VAFFNNQDTSYPGLWHTSITRILPIGAHQ